MHPHQNYLDWKSIEKASFGLIYGAILVLSLLLALGDTPEAPFEPAIVLFGSVLAVTLAKMFSEILAHGIETGERILTAPAFLAAWKHSHPTLTVANVPTALFILVGFGVISAALATTLSQAFCILVLLILGARVGWVINHSWWLPIAGALFAGSIGFALAFLKYAMH